jgi:hypothetical protein
LKKKRKKSLFDEILTMFIEIWVNYSNVNKNDVIHGKACWAKMMSPKGVEEETNSTGNTTTITVMLVSL